MIQAALGVNSTLLYHYLGNEQVRFNQIITTVMAEVNTRFPEPVAPRTYDA